MDIQVSMEEKARDVISGKGNILTVSFLSIENCCVPIGEVAIRYQKPENLEMFHQMNINNITLYIDKRIDFKKNMIKIKHSGIGPFRTVRVDGVSHF